MLPKGNEPSSGAGVPEQADAIRAPLALSAKTHTRQMVMALSLTGRQAPAPWYVDAMDFTEWDTRVSVYAVITDGHGHILLTWFNGSTPLWSLPGGGVEFEESLEAAVVREVFEETGFHVSVGRPLFTNTSTADVGNRSPRPFKAVRIIFEAAIVGGELGTTEIGGTTDEARWLPLTGLPDDEPRAGIVDQAYESLRHTTDS